MSSQKTTTSVHDHLLSSAYPAPPNTLMTSQSDDDGSVEIEFDAVSGYNYLCVVPSVFAPCFAPFFSLLARKNMAKQKCTVTDRRVVFEAGWLCHSYKSIPLDRIQDVNVSQNCVQACFGVKTLEIRTAGSGGRIDPEALLIAPVDAMMVRDVIMNRRDALVLGNPGTSTSGHHHEPSMGLMVEELRAIKAVLGRLETQVGAGVEQLKS